MKKEFFRLLCVVLILGLLVTGCGEKTDASTAVPTPSTEVVTEAPADPITTEKALRVGLDAGGRVALEGDITLTETIGITGQTLEGGGFTITGPELRQEEVETENGKELQNITSTENAVMITSGTVQNMKIVGAYRCIGDSSEYPLNKNVRIKNVYADGTLYALSVGRGNGKGTLYVEDCTLLGWNTVNKLATVCFTNCTFGWNTQGDSGHFRPYVDVEMIGCRFESKVDENGKETPYNITFLKSTSGVTLVLEDCYVGDTLITQENVTKLLMVTARDNRVLVRNTSTAS